LNEPLNFPEQWTRMPRDGESQTSRVFKVKQKEKEKTNMKKITLTKQT